MQLVTVCFITVVFCATVDARNVETRIINGDMSPNVPFYAYLEIFREPDFGGPTMYFGGGMFFSRFHILTVAQNVFGFKSWRIGLGANRISDMQWFDGTRAEIHPGYNNETLADNIALIRINQIPPTNSLIRAIHLLVSSHPHLTPFEGETLKIVGFGFDHTGRQPEQLQVTEIVVTNRTDCELNYPHLNETGQMINHFCARNALRQSNICGGDQGGPVYVTRSNAFSLFGIQSFIRVEDCSSPESQPPVFIRTTMYADWIRNLTLFTDW